MGNVPSTTPTVTIPPSLPIVSNETTPTDTDKANINYLDRYTDYATLKCDPTKSSQPDGLCVAKQRVIGLGSSTIEHDDRIGLTLTGKANPALTGTVDGVNPIFGVRINNTLQAKQVQVGNWSIYTNPEQDLCFSNDGNSDYATNNQKKTMCLSSTKDNVITVYQNSNSTAPYFYLTKTGGYGSANA
jgi:hypothetical protein